MNLRTLTSTGIGNESAPGELEKGAVFMMPKFIAIVGALVAITSTAILATLFATMLSVAAPNKTVINLVEPTIVGSVILQPGEYRIEWNGPGPDVQVSFSQGNKTIAAIPATLQALRNRVSLSLMYHTEESGARSLVEIETNRAVLHFTTTDFADGN
jgi:hypothetical protein